MRTIVAAWIACGAAACSPSRCPDDSNLGRSYVVVIVVSDATTGAPICDATVRVAYAKGFERADAAVDTLKSYPPHSPPGNAAGPSECFYYGSFMADVGTYEVAVSKPGYQSIVDENVVVPSIPCDAPLPDAPTEVKESLKPTM